MEITRRELLTGVAAVGLTGALPQALPGLAQAQTLCAPHRVRSC